MRKSRTIIFNKPYDVLPCFTDPEGRPTLADYIGLPGVYAAGRLDRDSEGLMILTSDGALAHRSAILLYALFESPSGRSDSMIFPLAGGVESQPKSGPRSYD